MLFFMILAKYITQPLIYRRLTMDNRKFEQLIDLIINENEEQAKALFHDIVVEKSREIYESMMEEDGRTSRRIARRNRHGRTRHERRR